MKWIKPINVIASLEATRSLDEEGSCFIKIQILDIASEAIISQRFAIKNSEENKNLCERHGTK